MGFFVVSPMMYIIFVAPPGKKKTTAMYIAKDLIREIGDVTFSADSQSKEDFIRTLSQNVVTCKDKNGRPFQYSHMSVFLTELSNFIMLDPLGTIDMLTTIYDCKHYDRKMKNTGQDVVPNPFITLLACTVPNWITAYLKQDIIKGGFSSRAIFVLNEDSDIRIPFPTITQEQLEAKRELLKYGHKLKSLSGEIVLSQEARDFYSHWYTSWQKPTDACLAPWAERKHIHVLKVAMLMSIAESLDLVIQVYHIQAAMELIEKVEADVPKIFEGMGQNPLYAAATRIKHALQKGSGVLSEAKLREILYSDLNQYQFDDVKNHLIQSGQAYPLVAKAGGNREKKFLISPEVKFAIDQGQSVEKLLLAAVTSTDSA